MSEDEDTEKVNESFGFNRRLNKSSSLQVIDLGFQIAQDQISRGQQAFFEKIGDKEKAAEFMEYTKDQSLFLIADITRCVQYNRSDPL